MNFPVEYCDLLEFKDTDAPEIEIGQGIISLAADLKNPYKYCSRQTLSYIKSELKLNESDPEEKLIELNTNTDPLKATNVVNLLHCGLIYHLDLLELVQIYPLSKEHFTQIRLMLYLITLIPKYGIKYNIDLKFIRKIEPNYLRYALLQYYPYKIDPIILNDEEIYQSFLNSKIPENYDQYNIRYQRFLELHTIDTEILNVLKNKLFKTQNLAKVVRETIQSNLEKIIINAKGLPQMIKIIGMSILGPSENIKDYFLENLIDYIHHTDPGKPVASNIFEAIELGMLPNYLSQLSDEEIIENCAAFVPYKSRKDLIKKMCLLASGADRFFLREDNNVPKICYGTLSKNIEYTARELEICFKNPGFFNADRTIEFSLFNINELIICLQYHPNFNNLIKLCQQKIKNKK